MVSAILKIILDLYYGQKLCNINAMHFVKHVILKMSLCFSVSVLAGLALKTPFDAGILRLLIVCPASMLVYTLLFYVYGLDVEEKRLTSSVISKLRTYVKR